jgi:hypothetical protein
MYSDITGIAELTLKESRNSSYGQDGGEAMGEAAWRLEMALKREQRAASRPDVDAATVPFWASSVESSANWCTFLGLGFYRNIVGPNIQLKIASVRLYLLWRRIETSTVSTRITEPSSFQIK